MESQFIARSQLYLIIKSGSFSCAIQYSIVAKLQVYDTSQQAPIKFPQQECLGPFIFSHHLALS